MRVLLWQRMAYAIKHYQSNDTKLSVFVNNKSMLIFTYYCLHFVKNIKIKFLVYNVIVLSAVERYL